MHGQLLRLERVTKHFGGLLALSGLTLSVPEGAIKALIGPNGAGKTTAFNLISGIYTPSSGTIVFGGHRIDGRPPHRLARLGLARTFQTVRLFPALSVLENVMVGSHATTKGGIVRCCLPFGRMQRQEAAARDSAMSCLELVGLGDRRDLPAGELPFGLQRLLEIARALATRPRLLLLDEPAAGLSAVERQQLSRLILELRRRGLTIFLIEHDMEIALGLADEVAALEYGRMLVEGEPREIQQHPEVIRAYLGS